VTDDPEAVSDFALVDGGRACEMLAYLLFLFWSSLHLDDGIMASFDTEKMREGV
jgi:hypothetical protein